MISNFDKESSILYIGTYTTTLDHVSGKGKGIYIYRFIHDNGEISVVDVCQPVINPSYLAIHPNKCFLYSVNETKEFRGYPGGSIQSFEINPETGNLNCLNQQPSLGSDPCYISMDKTGCYLFVANYIGGNIAVFPIEYDGKIGQSTDFHQHYGFSINTNRQASPHPHCVLLDPTNQYLLCADLGIDKIVIYNFDARSGKLTPNRIPDIQVEAGSGPRHLEFHPNNKWLYLINELRSTITVFQRNVEDDGIYSEIQTISTIPDNWRGVNISADIHIHPSGLFLYSSNRGHDSIAVYEINTETGKLTKVSITHTLGRTPRNFLIDDTGKWLLVANQDTDDITLFSINLSNGKLDFTGEKVKIPTPVCLKMMKLCTKHP